MTSNQKDTAVVMNTIEVEIRGRNGVTKANVFFDNGSDRTYVT